MNNIIIPINSDELSKPICFSDIQIEDGIVNGKLIL
tara:strand:- start:440 stop:547 length:108 start_codon:yes stop_codon:yes gene_type:complete